MIENTGLEMVTCTDTERFVRGGPTWTMDFLFDKRKEDPNTTLSGPPSAHQGNAI